MKRDWNDMIADWITMIREHASRNYEMGGWDFIIETWTDDDIKREIASSWHFGEALRRMATIAKNLGDHRRDIENA